ncbi:MAG: PhzF family phenazine biosynthesis protein [Oscillospiraceae bacterium]
MLDRPYSDEMLQRIARENNLSETAYLRKTGESWHLRWFTLNGEI